MQRLSHFLLDTLWCRTSIHQGGIVDNPSHLVLAYPEPQSLAKWFPCLTTLPVYLAYPVEAKTSYNGFQLSVESHSRSLWFCFTLRHDWLTKLISLSEPIRTEGKPNPTMT